MGIVNKPNVPTIATENKKKQQGSIKIKRTEEDSKEKWDTGSNYFTNGIATSENIISWCSRVKYTLILKIICKISKLSVYFMLYK